MVSANTSPCTAMFPLIFMNKVCLVCSVTLILMEDFQREAINLSSQPAVTSEAASICVGRFEVLRKADCFLAIQRCFIIESESEAEETMLCNLVDQF
jgi:hypothetical protein